ncbi:helix-turn-helix domain-containing protein [Sporomusa aerivorans]|uniref:helix-turn-helix domain-containing protein n=1 Tax=Sporomusa aerivorans TaxID=204936 RepID=UPI00352B2FB9
MMDIYTFLFKQVGRKVAYYRRLRNMTQEELAKRINISTSSLGKIERGKYNNNISLSMLMTIAQGLNIDVAMLVTFDERERAMAYEPADPGLKVMNRCRVNVCFNNDENKKVNCTSNRKKK